MNYTAVCGCRKTLLFLPSFTPSTHTSQKEEEKLRAAIRRENQQRRVRERHSQRGLTASYLEPDREEEEEEEEGGVSVMAIKSSVRSRLVRGYVEESEGSSKEEEEEEEEEEEGEGEEEGEERLMRAKVEEALPRKLRGGRERELKREREEGEEGEGRRGRRERGGGGGGGRGEEREGASLETILVQGTKSLLQ